jgi:hypothetical protein
MAYRADRGCEGAGIRVAATGNDTKLRGQRRQQDARVGDVSVCILEFSTTATLGNWSADILAQCR